MATAIIAAETSGINERVHRQAKNQFNVCEMWFYRDAAWQMFPIQPSFSVQHPVKISRTYRQPSTMDFTILDGSGLLNRNNKNSPYNYRNDTVTWDPLLNAKRKVRLRAGVRCYQNLTAGITPTCTNVPVIGTLSMLTDGNTGVIQSSGAAYVIIQPSTLSPVDITVDLGSSKLVHHYAIRFATKSEFYYTLPLSVNWGWSVNNVDWNYAKWPRPIGGAGGDFDDAQGTPGVTVEAIKTDIEVFARYVRFRIMPSVINQFIAIDELVVYGGVLGSPVGSDKFTGYIGGSTTPNSNGTVDITAMDVIKKLMDNNSTRLTPQYGGAGGPIDAADIIYSLLTAASIWKGSAGAYDSAFTAGEIAWTSGSNAANFKFPVWQGQSNNIYGYIAEILHSIGFDLQADGSGVLHLYEPPYRQVIPDRVFIADDDGNNDCWGLTPHDDDVDLRNKVVVRSGNPLSGATNTVVVQVNSVAQFGELMTTIDDPIALDQNTREKIAGYVIRDYAWRLGTITGTIKPDPNTGVKRVIAFRATRRLSMYARGYSATADIRSQQVWITEKVDETITPGDWTASIACSQYVGLGPTFPTLLTATPRIGVNTIIDLAWTAPIDGDVRDYGIYVSSVNDTDGFTLKPLHLVGGPTPSYAVTGLTPGTRYWFYVTAIGQNGQESAPSTVVSAVAGGASGDDSLWTITDLGVNFLQAVPPFDGNGFWEYEIQLQWTSPPASHSGPDDGQYGFKQGEFRLFVDAYPANPLLQDSWVYIDEWHGDRVPPLLMWDRVTVGYMVWSVRLKSNVNLGGGSHFVNFRVWTWNTTNGKHGAPHPSNIASVFIP